MNKIHLIKEIISNHQYQEIEGTVVDVQTANIILAVYTMLSEDVRDKYASDSIDTMIHMARTVVQ